MSLRINISVSQVIKKIIDEAAKKFYNGNRSQFLADAGVKYAEELNKEKNLKEETKR
jgi:metal-responsive CopG/Arc/MetJ family transcriptional regulator